MALMQKNKDPERWLIHKRNGQGPSAATSAIFRAEAEGRTLVGHNSLVHTSGQSLGPGGRRLKTVDSGMRGLFEEDDEEGVDMKRRREKEYGGEGDLDEVEWEEDFADDDEAVDLDDTKDEEAKEIEVSCWSLSSTDLAFSVSFNHCYLKNRNVLNVNTGMRIRIARDTLTRTRTRMKANSSLGLV